MFQRQAVIQTLSSDTDSVFVVQNLLVGQLRVSTSYIYTMADVEEKEKAEKLAAAKRRVRGFYYSFLIAHHLRDPV